MSINMREQRQTPTWEQEGTGRERTCSHLLSSAVMFHIVLYREMAVNIL
jgi:hypothetical protein